MKIRTLLAAAGLAALTLLLAGCLDTSTLVKVNRDGSGTVEESFLLSSSFMESLQGSNLSMNGPAADAPDGTEPYDGESGVDAESAASEDAESAPPPPPDLAGLPSEQQLQEMAGRMGPGVSLVSVEPLKNERGSGYRAVFRFDDINQLKLNQNPAAGMPGTPASASAETAAATEETFSFKLTRGNPSVLQILAPSPRQNPSEGTAAAETMNEEDQAAMMNMMRQVYQDLRIRIAVEVPGSIVSTNASYRDGTRVTLLDLDFAQLLQDENRFQKLARANPGTMQEVKKLLEDTPGVKLELKDRVEIRFR